jgi:hypothetical protein
MVPAADVPVLKKLALYILTMFGSTYSWESAFSTINFITNKYCTRLTNEHLLQCLRVALTLLCQSPKHWQETESVISLINAGQDPERLIHEHCMAHSDLLCIQMIIFVELSFVLLK